MKTEDLHDRLIKTVLAVGREVDVNAVRAIAVDLSPMLERYRKAVEDAPRGAIWTGACVECGEAIELGDAITWRLRWYPQGPIHEECR